MTSFSLILVVAILLTGLIAGLFYAYHFSVIKGLGNLSDREYLSSFQSINRAILNPYFFISFMGCLLVLPVATWLSYKDGHQNSFNLLVTASIVYVVGVFGTTAFGNVPLNNLVDKIDIPSSSEETLRNMRIKFEKSWNTLNLVRTCAAILAFLLTIISAIWKS